MGVYEKEIRFYSDLKGKVPVRSPGYYFGAMSKVDDPDVILGRLKLLHRQPIWLVAIIGLIVQAIFGLMPRKYVLLIEDVSRFRLGDQEQGCSDQDILQALNTMAALHARYWDSKALESMSWVTPVELSAKLIQLGYLQAAGSYLKENREKLSDRQIKLHEWLKVHGVQLTEALGAERRTLLHGDFRVDNLCFDDDTGDVMLLDWQTMMAGSYGLELAYFLSTVLPAGTPQHKLDEMLAYYRTQLKENGIELSAEELRHEYELGMVAVVHRISPILHQSMLELGTGRGPNIMQSWIDSAYEKLEAINFENILEAR